MMVKSSITTAVDPVFNQLRETKATYAVELQGLLERVAESPGCAERRVQIRTTDELLTHTDRRTNRR